jgi:hypothetical protein
VARKFPTAAQKMIINLYAPFVRIGTLLSGQPEFFAKLRIDPSDFFAASRNPFNKIVCGVLAALGPAPAKTKFSMKRFCHTAGGSNSHADKG